jgi:hypothetical protein
VAYDFCGKSKRNNKKAVNSGSVNDCLLENLLEIYFQNEIIPKIFYRNGSAARGRCISIKGSEALAVNLIIIRIRQHPKRKRMQYDGWAVRPDDLEIILGCASVRSQQLGPCTFQSLP